MNEFLARIFALTERMKFVRVMCLPVFLHEFASLAMASDNGQTLRVAVGETKAPYVFSQEQRGVEVELITSLLKDAGYQTLMSLR